MEHQRSEREDESACPRTCWPPFLLIDNRDTTGCLRPGVWLSRARPWGYHDAHSTATTSRCRIAHARGETVLLPWPCAPVLAWQGALHASSAPPSCTKRAAQLSIRWHHARGARCLHADGIALKTQRFGAHFPVVAVVCAAAVSGSGLAARAPRAASASSFFLLFFLLFFLTPAPTFKLRAPPTNPDMTLIFASPKPQSNEMKLEGRLRTWRG